MRKKERRKRRDGVGGRGSGNSVLEGSDLKDVDLLGNFPYFLLSGGWVMLFSHLLLIQFGKQDCSIKTEGTALPEPAASNACSSPDKTDGQWWARNGR